MTDQTCPFCGTPGYYVHADEGTAYFQPSTDPPRFDDEGTLIEGVPVELVDPWHDPGYRIVAPRTQGPIIPTWSITNVNEDVDPGTGRRPSDVAMGSYVQRLRRRDGTPVYVWEPIEKLSATVEEPDGSFSRATTSPMGVSDAGAEWTDPGPTEDEWWDAIR